MISIIWKNFTEENYRSALRFWSTVSLLSLLLLASTALGDSGTQTDWSGSSGVWGPVLEFGTDYSWDTGTNPSGFPGDLSLGYVNDILEHEVIQEYEGAYSVRGTDMDGDGDVDILGCAWSDGFVDWFENLDGLGSSWAVHSVDSSYYGVAVICPADLDGDGDRDVIGIGNDSVVVWKNQDGIGTVWEKYIVTGDYDDTISFDAGDIDGDGDPDIVSSSLWLDRHSWFENLDGTGESWQEHVIDTGLTGFQWVVSVDVDEDGDQDVLKTGDWSTGWYENTDGSGANWVKHIIDDDWVGACIQPADIDGDGDLDVVGCYDGGAPGADVVWFENTDDLGLTWEMHLIDNYAWGAQSVWAEDFDRDGDIDVAGAILYQADKDITWWENLDGQGLTWGIHVVDTEFPGSKDIHTADVNGDGAPDIIASGAYGTGDSISWWEILSHPEEGYLESSILYTQCSPLWGSIAWTSDEPEGTEVGFQLRVCAQPDTMASTAWSDTLWSPGSLEEILEDGNPFVQYRVFLKSADPDTTPVLHEVILSWDPLGIGEPESSAFELLPAAPNPSSGSVILRFTLPQSSSVVLSVYDLAGRCVISIPEAVYIPGIHSVTLKDLMPGVYFCRMDAGAYCGSRRFIVIGE